MSAICGCVLALLRRATKGTQVCDDVTGLVHFHAAFAVHEIRHLPFPSSFDEFLRDRIIRDIFFFKCDAEFFAGIEDFGAKWAMRFYVKCKHAHHRST